MTAKKIPEFILFGKTQHWNFDRVKYTITKTMERCEIYLKDFKAYDNGITINADCEKNPLVINIKETPNHIIVSIKCIYDAYEKQIKRRFCKIMDKVILSEMRILQ